MVPMYSMTRPLRGHMSLKSSPFSLGLSYKLSNQYIIQDHMVAHYKKLMSAKAAVDSSAPKSLHTSVKYKDQQKRHRLIQALQKYKDLVHGLPASPFNSRSVSPSQQKVSQTVLENGHVCLIPGWNDCSKTKREKPHSVSFQKPTSRTLMPAPIAKRTIQNTALHALSQTPVHNCSTDRSSASLLQSRMHLGSHNRKKKAFQNSFKKTYSGDLLDKHSVYFTEKQWFIPQILRTSHQSFLAKHRYYNPPPKKKISSPGRPPLKAADVNNEKKRELHRFLEDAHVRPHSVNFSQQPVEQNHELQIPSYEMPLCSGSQIEEKGEEYLHFLQDLTNDILIRSCYHEEALEDVFQLHIKSKRYNLDEVHTWHSYWCKAVRTGQFFNWTRAQGNFQPGSSSFIGILTEDVAHKNASFKVESSQSPWKMPLGIVLQGLFNYLILEVNKQLRMLRIKPQDLLMPPQP